MITPISYLQWDGRWKNVSYTSTGSQSQTIGNSGCGPTCAVMVVATLKDKTVTPVEACKYAKINGYRTANSGTDYRFFKPYLGQYGIQCEQITPSNLRDMQASKSKPYKEKLITALKNGKWAVCAMGKGHWTKSGHYILAYGIDSNGKILIRDPNSTTYSKTHGEQSVFLLEIKHYWLIEVGGEKVPGLDHNEWMKCFTQMRHDLQDNDASSWSQEARDWATDVGLVKGSSDGEFNGMWEDLLTREQMVTILFRFAQIIGKA